MAEDREHRIRERAYRIWEEQGRPDGQHEEHWRQASQETGDELFGQQEGGESGASANEEERTKSGLMSGGGGTGPDGGLSSGLQPGGTIPGQSPGVGTGSIGTGGGSTAGEATGTLGRQREE